MSYLIGLCIFGTDFNKVKDAEIVYQLKRVTTIHILSIGRLDSVLNIDWLSGVKFEEQHIKFSASTKAFIEQNRNEVSGYIIRRRNNTIKIYTTQNQVIRCPAP